MPTAKKRGSRKRKQAEERKALMSEVAERDKKNGKDEPKRYLGVQVEADDKPKPKRKRFPVTSEPTAESRAKAHRPIMGKPKKREELSLWDRWFESHGNRFESEAEAREHFQEKVCTHPQARHVSTKNRPGGLRIHIYFCACGKMIESKSPPTGH
jgi:hypothetical protein